jgi:uncharacterized protein YbjT (DUF2867 family)
VRSTSDSARRDALRSAGTTLVTGDLKDRVSLDAACQGVTAVISTVSAILSRQPGDSLAAVDDEGQQALVNAARSAGVEHFVYVSFPESPLTYPLDAAKRATERRLLESGMSYTILRPTNFMESWLSPALGFDYAGRKARIYGPGTVRTHWISVDDVAFATADSARNPRAKNRVLDLGGPEDLSLREVVGIFEEVAGARFALEEVSDAALKAQYDAASDPTAKSFAGLMLAASRGTQMDVRPSIEVFQPASRVSVRDYARRVLEG